MDSATASRLAEQLDSHHEPICHRVAARLLRSYPELMQTLRLDERHQPVPRLAQVSVERMSELVRSVLLFELPSLADKEFTWAHDILVRSGVTQQHQLSMVRWFFEELRRTPLGPAELELAREIERHFLSVIRQLHQTSWPDAAPLR
jgi:hypothetical protein